MKKTTRTLTKKFPKLWMHLVLILVLFLVSVITTEILFRLLFSATKRTEYSINDLQEKLVTVIHPEKLDVLGASTTAETSRHILHPYVGFIADPDQNPNINQLGWSGPNPVGKRSPNTLRVILFGGSVAQQFYEAAGETLLHEIRSDKRFGNTKIELYSAALSGYKQPQHLEAFTYLLSLGAEYDIIINLDGFNEIALPYAENWRNHVATNYPRGWNYYSKKTVNTNALDAMIHLEKVRSERKKLAAIFDHNPFKNSVVALIIWNYIDAHNRVSEYLGTQFLSNTLAGDARSYQTHGPSSTITDQNLMFQELTATWFNSSLQMARLAAANNITYIHLLQPNQYVPNSKKFTGQEEKYALAGKMPNIENNVDEINADKFNVAVKTAYPMLQKEGERLKSHQVHFHDLTGIFLNIQETIYKDSCCHVNAAGNVILASTIAQIILTTYSP